MEETKLLAELGAALTSPGLADSVARFARRHELVELAAAFCEHRKQEESAAAAAAAATAAPATPEVAPPIAAWGDGSPTTSHGTSTTENVDVSGKTEEWKPAAWDPGSAFNAFQQETPQGSRRGSAAKARGRGARRNSSRRSAPAVEEQTLPRKEPDNSSSSATNLPFNFHGLQIGEESDEKVPDADFDGVGVAEMDTEVDPEPATGQSPLRASVVPPGKPPTSGESDSFVPATVASPGLTAATVPQFNMGAPVSRSSRGKPRRKSRQREVPSQGSSTAGVDAPPIASSNVGEKPDSATAESTSSDKASIAAANRLRAEGNTAYNRSDYLGAVASYSSALEAAKRASEGEGVTTAEILRCRAICLTNRAAALKMLNRLPEALEDCRSAMAQDRGYVKAHTRAAKYHLQRAETEQAHDCLDGLSPGSLTQDESAEIETIETEIRQLRADMSRLEELIAAGDGPAAASLLAKAPLAPLLSNQANCPRLRAVNVGTKLLCGRDAEALHETRMWIAEKPADGAELAWTTLGRCHLWMCNVDDVAKLPTQNTHITSAATVVRLATTARECKSRGNAQFQAGDYSAAEKSYSDGAKAIEKSPDESVWGQRFRAVLLTNRAAARARQQHWLDALADCHLALRLYPQYLKALKRRGDLYQALGLFAEAASDFEAVCRAAAKDPQDTLASSARAAMSACTRSTRLGQPKKLYKILSLSPDATSSEIKKAYRELALRYHPDKCAEPSAELVFKIVGEAYDTLCDSSRRSAYDRSCASSSSRPSDMDHDWQRRWGRTSGARAGGRYR